MIIHSTNAAAVVGMENVMQEAGWTTSRVVPFEDMQWIPTIWFRAMRDAIVAAVEIASPAVEPPQ